MRESRIQRPLTPGLKFWSVRDRSLGNIWAEPPAFQAYRGTDWMVEPCRSCPREGVDFSGCRCQALALTGNAREADPVCHLSPFHDPIDGIVLAEAEGPVADYSYKGRTY